MLLLPWLLVERKKKLLPWLPLLLKLLLLHLLLLPLKHLLLLPLKLLPLLLPSQPSNNLLLAKKNHRKVVFFRLKSDVPRWGGMPQRLVT